MAVYIALQIPVSSEQQKEILLARLSEEGATGFEEEKTLLKAFFPEHIFNEILCNDIIQQSGATYLKSYINEKNWNAEWEAGFAPVAVGDFCMIRAGFHPPPAAAQHDIIITPKMSFGTGHHATTFMMVKAMAELRIAGKSIFDFGTGTGVLAILADKMGAVSVTAIDNDEWSISNSIENFNSNNCHKILLNKDESIDNYGVFDIILANINRNIILENLGAIKQHLAPGGVVLLSGLLTGDELVVAEKALQHKLVLRSRLEMNGWICLQMVESK